MSLDTFVLSILFDDKKANESAKKIENIVDNMAKGLLKSIAAFASVDFLEKAVATSTVLATKFDNLSYLTNINKEDISAWGEAVKRTGGTIEGFYNSLGGLSGKLRDLQTNFGATAGQGAFMRLGINLQDSNGHMKNSIQLLTEIGDKLKNMPKVWQLRLGEQLGLDPATLRLISSGSQNTLELVERMKRLGNISAINTEQNIRFRNSLYDLSLLWQNIKITVGNGLIPILVSLSEILVRTFDFWQQHSAFVKTALIGLSTVIGTLLIPSILSVADAIITRLIPAFLGLQISFPVLLGITAAILAIALVVEDFTVYMRGGNSALGGFYDHIKKLLPELRELVHLLRIPFHYYSVFNEKVDAVKEDLIKKDKDSQVTRTKDMIVRVAKSVGVDPTLALAVATRENAKFDPKLKSDVPGSTAEGLFQVTDPAYADALKKFGLKDRADSFFLGKSNPYINALAGITNLKTISEGLQKFFGRDPTRGEIYLGEMYGLSGSEKLFSAKHDTAVSHILSRKAIQNNNLDPNMTAGQLIRSSNDNINKTAVSIGNINISAPNANAHDLMKHARIATEREYTKLAINADNGVQQ